MKTITFLRKLLPFVPLLALSSKGNAQTNQPIGCNGQFFVSHGAGVSTTNPSELERLTFSGLTVTPNDFVSNPATHAYNAIGLNPIDGYMYGMRYENDNDGSGAVQLIRVGTGAANVNNIGTVTSSSGGNALTADVYAGCFDKNGVYYFIDHNNNFFSLTNAQLAGGSMARVATYIADLNGAGVNTPPNSTSGKIVDIAINPVDDKMYAISMSGNNSTDMDYRLYEVNIANGALTRKGAATGITGQYPHPGNSYLAALFFDEVGNLFGYRSDGAFLKIDIAAPQSSVSAGTGPGYTAADGCSCSFGRVFHDITSQKGICPGLGGINNPEWDITVAVTNQSNSQKTGLTYTLEIPSNRFSIIETPAVIAARLFTAGLIPANNPALVTISTVAPAVGATKNKIVVTSFQTGAVNSTVSFTLKLKVVTLGGSYASVPLQSNITGLPVLIGSNDLSNDPTTGTPDDPTIVTFCPNITLPVKLISFTGSYKNGTTQLNWVAENQINFAFYDVERSIDGNEFGSISIKSAQGNSTSKEYYLHNDDLSAESNKVFYYRLKMVDVDGSFKYSNVIVVRKETKSLIGITVNPNPVVTDNTATVRFEATVNGTVEFRVVDMAGRVILTQQNNVAEGANSVALNKLDRLQPGIYVLQMNDGTTVQTTKFVISQ